MRLYETAFLISPNLPEEESETLIKQMEEIISTRKGEMVNLEKWGKRKLAYPIKKFEEALYVFFLYKGEPDIPVELERRFKQTESILRYLTVKKDEKENLRGKKKKAPIIAEEISGKEEQVVQETEEKQEEPVLQAAKDKEE
ncbi:30S ribosomal protein S6 [Acidobacteriota bacterium]